MLRWRDLWRDDWSHVGERLDALRQIQALPDDDGYLRRTKPLTRPKPRTFAEWTRRYGSTRKTA